MMRLDATLWLNYGDCYATGSTSGPQGNSGQRADRTFTASGMQARAGNGLKPKDLVMMPARIALALQADGWWLRSEIIWAKPNPMPESITDRPTSSHEKMFLLARSARYFYDAEAVREKNADPERTNYAPGKEAYTKGNVHDASGREQRNDGFAAYANGKQCLGRNLRNVWHIATHPFPSAHFATFPPALVEPCIKAGTSEKGVCGACGAPWVRQVESEIVPTRKAAKTFIIDERDVTADKRDQGSNRQKDGHKPGHIKHVETVGCLPSCKCGVGGPVPAIVLDPFLGSGTSLLVADRLGRDGIGIELNPEYADMARARITQDSPLFAKVGT